MNQNQKQPYIQATDFRQTSTGHIALIKGRWYSVNGTRNDIMDIRYRLSKEDLAKFGVHNEE